MSLEAFINALVIFMDEKNTIWGTLRDLIKYGDLKIKEATSRGGGKATEIKFEGMSDDVSIVVRKSKSVGSAVDYKAAGKKEKMILKHLESKTWDDIK